jgi:hypothetical protein
MPIADLEISPATPGLLHAATYGRGVWVASVVPSNLPPVTSFAAPATGKCAGTALTFTDQSINSPTAWSWSVNPATNVMVTLPGSQNPSILFLNAGTYTVSAQTSNSIGAGNVSSQVITINPLPQINISGNPQTVCPGKPATFVASGAAGYTWSNGGGNNTTASFFPSSITVYSVTGSANGCTSVKTATAFIAAPPVVNISGAATICEGDFITLTASGANTYSWSTAATGSAVSISPGVTSTFSVYGTNAAGCTSTATTVVTVNPMPVLNITAGDTTVCANEEIVLTASGGSAYSWFPGGQSGTTVTFTPAVPTTYTVVGTDDNGCQNAVLFAVMVEECTGLGETGTGLPAISIFPNPTDGNLFLLNETRVPEVVTLFLLDVTGKVLFSKVAWFDATHRMNDLQLGNLNRGIYFVKIISEKAAPLVIKVMKE